MSHSKKILTYILFVFSLLIGLYLNENSSGGSKKDFNVLLPYIETFGKNFKEGLFFFFDNTATIIHSPAHYIFLGNLNSFFGNIIITKIFYIFLSSLLPFIFFLILKKKINCDLNILFIFSCLIFLSPYFRSSSIWITGDNLALIFFAISIFFYLNSLKNREKKLNFFLCCTFLILCCYIRYYYALFILFYFYEFYKELNLKWKMAIFFYCFIISLPAFAYFYYISINTTFLNTALNYTRLSYFGNLFLILSILFFYLFPFIVFNYKKIINYYSKNYKILIFIFSFLTFFLIIDFLSTKNLINFSIYGGGVFKKLFEFLNLNIKFSLYILSIISLTVLDYYFKDYRKKNYLLLLIIIISFPMFTIFQKYFDPLFYFLFFGLISFKRFDEIIDINLKKLLFIYMYFLFFLIFCIIYY